MNLYIQYYRGNESIQDDPIVETQDRPHPGAFAACDAYDLSVIVAGLEAHLDAARRALRVRPKLQRAVSHA